MNEFLEQFVVEARELIEQVTADLLALERKPGDRASLDGSFRAFHTLKGGAGIVDFAAMGRAMHAAEDVLSMVRQGDRPVTARLIGDCLACLDQVVQWLDSIEESGDLPSGADAAADRLAARFQTGEAVIEARTVEAPKTEAPVAAGEAQPSDAALAVLREQIALLAVRGEGLEGRIASVGRLAANVFVYLGRPDIAERIVDAVTASLAGPDPTGFARAIEAAMESLNDAAAPDPIEPVAIRTDPLSRSLRVDAERVDALVDLTGELTVTKNALGHIAMLAREGDNALSASLASEYGKLDRLIDGLQRAVLELRILPLRRVFQRFSRLAREMSESLAKPVRLLIEGEETQADKAIVEMLFEPLLHVVRNAMDHGVELSAERAAAGKSTIATIVLRARRDGEHVVVEVEDDGRGIDADHIRRAAVERGLATADTVAGMSEEVAIDLIFLPGFSTAADVTDLSGRGVGMDAVRESIERLGGRVRIETRAGAGSIVRFVLPFSVMMTRVMTVEAGGQWFGIPLDAVIETVRVRRDEIRSVGQAHALVLRNRTIPLIGLAATLGWAKAESSSDATVVVASSGGVLGGLEVDRLGARMDVMLKPAEGLLSGIRAIAGTTMLGDGQVLLVLDVREVFTLTTS
jgi:two-component system, chemotaxis family, sensor kinase CheA